VCENCKSGHIIIYLSTVYLQWNFADKVAHLYTDVCMKILTVCVLHIKRLHDSKPTDASRSEIFVWYW